MALPSPRAPHPPQLLLPGQRLYPPPHHSLPAPPSMRLPHRTHSPLVPGTQAAAWSRCWKWPPNRCAFNLFPGQRPPCPEEAASQAGGPEIAPCARPGLGLSITARPLPPMPRAGGWLRSAHLMWSRGSRLCPLGGRPLKEPIVTTWKGGPLSGPGSAGLSPAHGGKEAGGVGRFLQPSRALRGLPRTLFIPGAFSERLLCARL